MTVVDLGQYRQSVAEAKTADNVRGLAGALWWQNQAGHQRGDHVGAARAAVARTRLLAQAKRDGLKV